MTIIREGLRKLAYVVPLIVVVALFPFLDPSLYFLRLAAGTFMFIGLAQSWNLMGGYTGYLNLGHVVFLGVGAYTTGILSTRFDIEPFLTAPIGGLLAVLLAALIGFPSLRLRGPYFAILTLALVTIAKLVFQNITQFGGGLGIILPRPPFANRENEQLFYWTFVAIAVAVVLFAYLMEKSRFGLSLRAIMNDEDAARVFGVNVLKSKMLILMTSAFPAGFIGSIFAYQIGYIEPDIVFSVSMSITFVLMVMLGGAGRWLGPILGATIVYVPTQTLAFVLPDELNRVLFGLILMAVVFAVPTGILGASSSLRRWGRKPVKVNPV